MEKELAKDKVSELLMVLRDRFEQHRSRHPNMDWDAIQRKLLASQSKLWTLNEMERTGGEPDVIAYDSATGEYTFCDCSPESPLGRRSLCYDPRALEARKEHKPEGSAVDMARAMGVELLSESEYRRLQELGEFDLKTSSWLLTPTRIRTLGGAIFGDRRYDTVFTYHNGAQSYYASRGFRSSFRV